jgi:hypothetical protein
MGPPAPRPPALAAATRPDGPGGQDPVTGPAPPLLKVRDLVKEFPVTAGAVLQRQVAAVHAVVCRRPP